MMLSLNSFFSTLDSYAPLLFSKQMIEKGEYDNSGIIVRSHEEVNKVLFTLDLTEGAVKRAKKIGADTICTHHPAIYTPIKNLSVADTTTSAVLLAVKYDMNVISMHLNLDVADRGIDYCLAKGLGAESYKIVSLLNGVQGYGREFAVLPTKLSDYVKAIKKEFGSRKIICYGKKTDFVKVVASFCGGGYDHALEYVKETPKADTIVTSDAPHHVLKELLDNGKKVIILPHYVSEVYGFIKYYEHISTVLKNRAECVFYDDKKMR